MHFLSSKRLILFYNIGEYRIIKQKLGEKNMLLESIEARDLPDAWFQCVDRILDVGREYVIDRGSYEGQKRLEYGYLEEYLPYLMTSGKKEGEDYTYGDRLEYQIQQIIEMYKRDGYRTNQACMSISMPTDIDLGDPPCLRSIDCRILDGKLHFVVYFRSWCLWNGFPANLGAIQLMKEYMAGEIGAEDGEIIASSKGLHLYDYVWELAKLRTNK
jgi:thymidylate synthase